MKRRFLSTVIALVCLLALATTSVAATTEVFFGGYSDYYTPGNIVVELTNISSMKNVILSEKEAADYFDEPDMLDAVVDYFYDEDIDITVRDVLAYYNANGGVPTYYADSAPVVVSAITAMRIFYFTYNGDTVKYEFKPRYFSFVEYIDDFEHKRVYDERPEELWLYADGTNAVIKEPGKYLFIFTDDGLISSAPPAMFCLHIADTSAGTPVQEELKEVKVAPTSSRILVNGKAVEFEAYNINGYNYFKLRDLAQAVNNTEKNFEITWDGTKKAISLISHKKYTPAGDELTKGDGKAKLASPTTSKIYKDGVEVSLIAYNINGYNYFKLRDITKLFDIGVSWDGTTNTIVIDTSASYVE